MELNTHYTEPFWDGLEDGDFTLQQCKDCEEMYFPPSPVCPHCHSDQVEWTTIAAVGELYAFTCQRRTPRGFDSPTVFGIVEFNEDVRILTLINAAYKDLTIGMNVRIKPMVYAGGFNRGRLDNRPYFTVVPTEQ